MRWRLQNLVAVALAGLWGGGVYLAHSRGHLQSLDRAEAAITDFRTVLRGVKTPPDLLTIVEIDEAVENKFGSYPLARSDLAKIVDAIAGLKPRVLALDLLLIGTGEGDDALAKALGAGPAVIAAAAIFPTSSQSLAVHDRADPLERLPRAEWFQFPLKKFADQAQVGIVNVTTDQTGTPRSIPMLFRTDEGIAASFPFRIASLAIGGKSAIEPDRLVLGDHSVPTVADYALPVTFYGPRRTIRTISAAALLDGKTDAAAIAGKIVVVGATISTGGDFFPTPFERQMPGVEVVATAITQLMTGDVVLRGRIVRSVDALICVLLPMILVGLLAWRRSVAGLFAAVAVIVIWMSITSISFSRGIWLSAILPIAATAVPTLLFGAVQLWSGRRRAQYFATRSQLLGEFQAPVIQQWLIANPRFLAEPVRQDAAIVFIDLSGFTSLSEALGPDKVRDLLKEFHALVDKEVVTSGGMITSFLGDGAMILFGLPEPAPDDALRAADCAVRLSRSTAKWLGTLPQSIAANLGFKIGAHFGIIVASRLGGASHHHITATGDTVNVASRLMEVAAGRGVEIAASDDLLRAAGHDCALFRSGVLTGPQETQIRGRSGSLATWLWRGAAPLQAQA
jgi:adenylate cyclase